MHGQRKVVIPESLFLFQVQIVFKKRMTESSCLLCLIPTKAIRSCWFWTPNHLKKWQELRYHITFHLGFTDSIMEISNERLQKVKVWKRLENTNLKKFVIKTMNSLYLTNRKDWRRWLAKNHQKKERDLANLLQEKFRQALAFLRCFSGRSPVLWMDRQPS